MILDFLLPPASSPLLAQGAGPGAIASPIDRSPAATNDEPFTLVPNPMCMALPSTTTRPPASSVHDTTDSVHGTVSVPVSAFPGSPATTTGLVHGAAHVLDAAPTLVPSRHRGMTAPITNLVVMTHAECHTHTMVTRWAPCVALSPADQLNLSAMTSPVISPILTDYHIALANPHWRAAMQEEFHALLDNGTWTFVPCPTGANVVSEKWGFKHKFHLDGTLSLSLQSTLGRSRILSTP
jgi:hypothetical protein